MIFSADLLLDQPILSKINIPIAKYKKICYNEKTEEKFGGLIMKTRIFVLLLALVLMLSCFVSCGEKVEGGADSTDTDAITGNVPETDAKVDGGVVSVSAEVVGNQLFASVAISGNQGLAAFNIQLHYDNTKLRPVEITDSELVEPSNIVSNIQQGGDVVANLEFATALYINPTDFTGDGVLYVMSFEILEGASGETELTLVSNVGDNANQNLEDVIFTLEGCTVNLG